MRLSRIIWLGPAIFALAAIPVHAGPVSRASLLVQPSRVDFDQDGRADTAAGVLANPSVVRITSSRTGVRDISQPAPVLAVAGFDYDRDGDLDLLVGTSQGALLWVNDGQGAFSALPLLLAIPAPDPSSSSFAAPAGAAADFCFERTDPAAIHDRCAPPRGVHTINLAGPEDDSVLRDWSVSGSSPRAPPVRTF